MLKNKIFNQVQHLIFYEASSRISLKLSSVGSIRSCCYYHIKFTSKSSTYNKHHKQVVKVYYCYVSPIQSMISLTFVCTCMIVREDSIIQHSKANALFYTFCALLHDLCTFCDKNCIITSFITNIGKNLVNCSPPRRNTFQV